MIRFRSCLLMLVLVAAVPITPLFSAARARAHAAAMCDFHAFLIRYLTEHDKNQLTDQKSVLACARRMSIAIEATPPEAVKLGLTTDELKRALTGISVEPSNSKEPSFEEFKQALAQFITDVANQDSASKLLAARIVHTATLTKNFNISHIIDLSNDLQLDPAERSIYCYVLAELIRCCDASLGTPGMLSNRTTLSQNGNNLVLSLALLNIAELIGHPNRSTAHKLSEHMQSNDRTPWDLCFLCVTKGTDKEYHPNHNQVMLHLKKLFPTCNFHDVQPSVEELTARIEKAGRQKTSKPSSTQATAPKKSAASKHPSSPKTTPKQSITPSPQPITTAEATFETALRRLANNPRNPEQSAALRILCACHAGLVVTASEDMSYDALPPTLTDIMHDCKAYPEVLKHLTSLQTLVRDGDATALHIGQCLTQAWSVVGGLSLQELAQAIASSDIITRESQLRAAYIVATLKEPMAERPDTLKTSGKNKKKRQEITTLQKQLEAYAARTLNGKDTQPLCTNLRKYFGPLSPDMTATPESSSPVVPQSWSATAHTTLQAMLDSHRHELPVHQEQPRNLDKEAMREAIHAHDPAWRKRLSDEGLRPGLPELHELAHAGDALGIHRLITDHIHWILDQRGLSGETALHQAVAQQHVPTVNMLLTWKAHPHAQNEDGKTPLDIARQLNATTIINLLEQAEEHPIAHEAGIMSVVPPESAILSSMRAASAQELSATSPAFIACNTPPPALHLQQGHTYQNVNNYVVPPSQRSSHD